MTEGGDGGGGSGGDERDWAIWLRLLSHSVRDTSVSASTDDTAVLQAVRKLHELCKIGGGGDLVARVYPPLTKLFQRCCASVVSSQRSSTGLLLLTILQFFLDFGEFVLHDGDPSLRTFFRSFLSRMRIQLWQLQPLIFSTRTKQSFCWLMQPCFHSISHSS
jgi:AP-5 complex subunit zeta-1